MRQYQRQAVARPWTSVKMAALKMWFAALVVMGLMACTQAAYAFTLLFDQSAYHRTVWLQVQDAAQTFAATYANGTQSIDFMGAGTRVLMSVPVKLSDIGAGGLNITFSSGAIIFLFYDNPTGNSRTAAPDFSGSTQRFMTLELTMTGGTGDQGNLTAINYFTAPLSIRSYQNNPSLNPGEPVLQQTGFGSATAAQIGAQFAAITVGNPSAVVKNAQGKIVRYLGPSNTFIDSFGKTIVNPWPSFIPYTQSIHAANQATTIQRTNGFNFAAPDNLPVYQFGADMTATANADGSLTITGRITVSGNAPIKTGAYGNPQPPNYVYDGRTSTWTGYWTGATISFPVSNPSDPQITANTFNNAIYGQVDKVNVNGSNKQVVYYTGQAWNDFLTFTQSTLKDPTKPHDINTNPSLNDPIVGSAYNTTIAMFIGEVTTGILGGFFNSDYQVGGVALKNMTSNQWWSLNPIVAFSEIQPLNPYYNIYAQVIFDTSNNTVYGVPYSDRFGTGPLVNSVNYNGTPVNYWIIGIGAPLGTTALTGMLQLLLLE